MPKVVISNTSPIFYLHRLGYLELLERLYGEILIPYAVLEELKEGERTGEDVPDIGEYKWIKLRNVAVPSSIKTIPDLGKGEAEVLALGLEEKEHLLIIDDSLARKIAKLQSLKFTGTAGILVKAKEKGLINELKPILDLLKDKRFFLREKVIADILKLSGEV
jgi:predicted nucleic acid-binding protein